LHARWASWKLGPSPSWTLHSMQQLC
jgi:hypothetical protein